MDELVPEILSRRQQARWHPWKADDMTRGLLGQLVGLAMMAASWFEVSSQVTVRGELTWLNLGVVGLLMSGVGNAMWLLQGRRNVGTARVMVLPDPQPRTEAAVAAGRDARVVVKTHGVTMYHRPGCPLVAGKPTVARGARNGRVPCQVCQA